MRRRRPTRRVTGQATNPATGTVTNSAPGTVPGKAPGTVTRPASGGRPDRQGTHPGAAALRIVRSTDTNGYSSYVLSIAHTTRFRPVRAMPGTGQPAMSDPSTPDEQRSTPGHRLAATLSSTLGLAVCDGEADAASEVHDDSVQPVSAKREDG